MDYLKDKTQPVHQGVSHWSVATALQFVDEEMARLVASDPSFRPTMLRGKRAPGENARARRRVEPSLHAGA